MMQMIQSFGRHMTAWTAINWLLATGYGFRGPVRCPRLTLVHWRRRREWEQRHQIWDLRHRRHCIFSAESRFFIYHSDGGDQMRRRQGERLRNACIQGTRGNRGPSEMVWGAIIHGGGATWSSWMGRWTGNATSRFWGITCYHGGEGVIGRSFAFVQDNAPSHIARDTGHFCTKVMDWHTMSPGINAIEHGNWDQMSS